MHPEPEGAAITLADLPLNRRDRRRALRVSPLMREYRRATRPYRRAFGGLRETLIAGRS